MLRILLVDDDESFRKMVHLTLERAGHDIVDARDGNEAMKLFRATPFDLVVTDLVMPDKEGLETILELRAERPGIRIIAMSGGGRNSPGNYLKVAGQMGAAEVLAKPFSNQELFDAVESVTRTNPGQGSIALETGKLSDPPG